MKKLLVGVGMLACSLSFGDCWMDNKQYPVGVIVGEYLCKDNGEWEEALKKQDQKPTG